MFPPGFWVFSAGATAALVAVGAGLVADTGADLVVNAVVLAGAGLLLVGTDDWGNSPRFIMDSWKYIVNLKLVQTHILHWIIISRSTLLYVINKCNDCIKNVNSHKNYLVNSLHDSTFNNFLTARIAN